jgi:hypothetical protein
MHRLLVAANVVPSSPIFATLMKEALGFSETSVLTRATRRNIPEDTILHSHCREKPKILHRRNSKKNQSSDNHTDITLQEWCLLGCYAVRCEEMVFLRSVRRLLVAACVVPSSPIFVTRMEAPGSSETSVLTRATWRNNPEDTILHSHRRENLKSYITLQVLLRLCKGFCNI